MPKPAQKSGAKKQPNTKSVKPTTSSKHIHAASDLYQSESPACNGFFPNSPPGERRKVSRSRPQPIIVREPLPAATTNSSAPVKASSECSLTEIFQCLMDLVRDNPSHGQIILRAFGLAKDKMRNS
ncbi:hypothetical protein CDAR_206491 [Caerostris darwini]|nr:hypothetical protein CDAR_104741 [Caerostris darwini]GIY29216.1 hypothetical protein CDAR_206491 [Caerostris darwini]